MGAVLHRAFDWRGPDRLVLVHGFTQTLRSWDRLAASLSDAYQVVRVDLPGHGGSGAVEMTFEEIGRLVGGLPASAAKWPAWWANETAGSTCPGSCVARLGSEVESVDRARGRVRFSAAEWRRLGGF